MNKLLFFSLSLLISMRLTSMEKPMELTAANLAKFNESFTDVKMEKDRESQRTQPDRLFGLAKALRRSSDSASSVDTQPDKIAKALELANDNALRRSTDTQPDFLAGLASAISESKNKHDFSVTIKIYRSSSSPDLHISVESKTTKNRK